ARPTHQPGAAGLVTLRPLRSRSCGAFGPGWPPLRSSHLEALRAATAGPAARASQRAYGPSGERG
ncbi:hypothetical protein, partial [Streptomyces rochei]|uniref:hypothetical protein n=1 Tax=Streptomyces rochei TaxID=1928 RepID=UPI0033BBFEAB